LVLIDQSIIVYQNIKTISLNDFKHIFRAV